MVGDKCEFNGLSPKVTFYMKCYIEFKLTFQKFGLKFSKYSPIVYLRLNTLFSFT